MEKLVQSRQSSAFRSGERLLSARVDTDRLSIEREVEKTEKPARTGQKSWSQLLLQLLSSRLPPPLPASRGHFKQTSRALEQKVVEWLGWVYAYMHAFFISATDTCLSTEELKKDTQVYISYIY